MHGKVEACPALAGVLVETTDVGWLLATSSESRVFIPLSTCGWCIGDTLRLSGENHLNGCGRSPEQLSSPKSYLLAGLW